MKKLLATIVTIAMMVCGMGLLPGHAYSTIYDVPDVTDYISVPLTLGQKGSNSKQNCNSYTYDYLGDDLSAEWAKPFLDAITSEYDFKQVDYVKHDWSGVSGNIAENYYFYYTGGGSVHEVSDDILSDGIATHHLTVTVFHYYAEGRVGFSIHLSQQLSYAGKDTEEGSVVGEKSSSYDYDDDWHSKKTSVKCTKCHGKKEIDCTQCNGDGGKWVYVSVGKYDANQNTTSGSKWENCNKCHGSGRITCTRCNGSGVE